MTRFSATDPARRRSLYAEAIRAHRARGSPFVTFEAEPSDDGGGEDADVLDGTVAGLDGDPDAGDEDPAPWIQFADDRNLCNLDCTDEELDALKALLEAYPAFRIDDLTRPEDAEGTNVRISARADEKRIADFVDEAFLEVYGAEERYRGWVVEV